MAGKFELKKSADDKFYFNLKSGNGQVILTSEMYNTRRSAENGIDSVRKSAPEAKRFDRRQSQNGKPYFVLKAGNGQVIGNSEMYDTPASMEKGIAAVSANAPAAPLKDLTAYAKAETDPLTPASNWPAGVSVCMATASYLHRTVMRTD